MGSDVIRPTRRDFLLKPELLRAISDLGFEHPSEGEALPNKPLDAHELTLILPPSSSPAGVYPPVHPRHGRAVPGQVWYG